VEEKTIVKIKYCCADMEKNIIYGTINAFDGLYGVEGDYFSTMWVSNEDTVIIRYCPFCGKKIVIEGEPKIELADKYIEYGAEENEQD